jgi:hypothetical protein
MDRRDRDRYDRNNQESDYGRYEGYSNDEHYHGARNLTDQFEREYRRDHGYSDNYRDSRPHTYHEGDMGDAYERRRRDLGSSGSYSDSDRNDWNRNRNYGGNFSSDRGRFSNDQNDSWGNRDSYRSDRDRNQDYGNRWQGYSTTDRYGSGNRYDNRSTWSDRGSYSGSGSNYSGSRYGDRNYSSRGGAGSYGLEGDDRYERDRDGRSGRNWREKNRI